MPYCDTCDVYFRDFESATCQRCLDMYAEQDHQSYVEEQLERERCEASPRHARMQDLLDKGVAVYLNDLFDTAGDGNPIPEKDRNKWFVSVPFDSPHASAVRTIPLAATEEEAWELAHQHLCANRSAGDQ
ncbi:hypothetical protein ACUXLG_005831 [Ralstonia sp. 121560039-2]|jgi:hypothetical protein|nr:hypothetical protein [Ralstonia insidiosa]MBA9940422.1 hypothetical protein [Ralstonia insidiosa]